MSVAPLTPWTRESAMAEGAAARRAGMSRVALPMTWHPLQQAAWLEGYDSARAPETLAKVFPAGGPLLAGTPLGEDGPLLASPMREGWDG